MTSFSLFLLCNSCHLIFSVATLIQSVCKIVGSCFPFVLNISNTSFKPSKYGFVSPRLSDNLKVKISLVNASK